VLQHTLSEVVDSGREAHQQACDVLRYAVLFGVVQASGPTACWLALKQEK